MNDNCKGWTLVNDDLSLQPNAGSDTSPKCKDKNAIESDSDQDFEILAKPNAKSLSSQSLAKFNGIYIKEDHFAEGTEDGSDIEVIKTTDKIKDETFNFSDSDDRESIELLGFDKLCTTEGTDSDFQNVGPIEKELLTEALGDLFESKDSSIDTTFVCDDSNSDEFEPKNEFEGLIELFENETEDEEDGALLDIASLFQSPDCDDNGHCTSSQDVKVLNDGIILTPSMFIILLCLSVFAGIFIGKGLSLVSQSYQIYLPQTDVSVNDMKASKATKSSEEIGSEGKFNSLMNETSYESLSFEAMKSKNESRDAAKMRVAYEEMQLKYLRLEKRYRDLGQQYRAQKQTLLFSKKRHNFKGDRHAKELNCLSNKNQSNIEKEILWWKMRTAVWRQSYLDLKVKFNHAQKTLTQRRNDSITFKACTGFLTRYIPDLNVTRFLANSSIATGAKLCWQKVLRPVKVVGEQVGSGLYGFSRKVDGFWVGIKSKWGKAGNDNKNHVHSVHGKLTSKWRRFKEMVRMSNIVCSFGSGQNVVTRKEKGDKAYCSKNPISLAKHFDYSWNYRGKVQAKDTSYPTSKASRGRATKQAIDSDEIESRGPCLSSTNQRESRGKEPIELRPCPGKAKLVTTRENKELKSTDGAELEKKMDAKGDIEELKQKMREFKNFDKDRKDYLKKREIVEKKMRYYSNKRRDEKQLFRKRKRQLEKKIKRILGKFESVFEIKMHELKNKKRKMEKELKKRIQMNKEEKKRLDEDRRIFALKVKDIEQKLHNAEAEQQQRRADFEKLNEDITRNILRQNAERFNMRYNEERKLKQKHLKLVEKMREEINKYKVKLQMKKQAMILRMEQLRSTLRRLLQEENVKQRKMKKIKEKLNLAESREGMVKLFYAENLKMEKENHARAKDMVWQMKRRMKKLEAVHDEIQEKYKKLKGKLGKEKENPESEESKTEKFYPSVYCPDQNSCKGNIKVNGHAYTRTSHSSTFTVFCPGKESCRDKVVVKQNTDGFYEPLKMEQWNTADSKITVLRRNMADRPVPPNSNPMAKKNPFFINLKTKANLTNEDDGTKRRAVRSETDEPSRGEQDSSWYFSLMKDRAKQRAVPLSWYLYWSHGRSIWRGAPGKDSEDNWYLKLMQEREMQRSKPTNWFKRAKGREEGQNIDRAGWFLNRGKGREEARKKEGFYYCW